MNDDFLPDIIRSPEEVARRLLALVAIVGIAFGADKADVVRWLEENQIRTELTPSEARFIEASPPSKQQIVDAGWLSERLLVLCWALGDLAGLPNADEQCDTSIFLELLPPFSGEDVFDFVARAKLRRDEDLVALADEMLSVHWEARNAELKDVVPRFPVNIEIVQERHHAINWIIGYDGLPWDEVTTDT